jgi:GNAT superfamily N-acetyltransferase
LSNEWFSHSKSYSGRSPSKAWGEAETSSVSTPQNAADFFAESEPKLNKPNTPTGKRPSIRPAATSDQPFLFRVYASTRTDELNRTGWNEAQCDAFLRSQFAARRQSYAQQFLHAETLVVGCAGHDAGALIIDRTTAEIRIVDMALLPVWRGAGLGRQLIEDLQLEAATTRKPLRLSVHVGNRARHLYERMGFKPQGVTGDYLRMEWLVPKA